MYSRKHSAHRRETRHGSPGPTELGGSTWIRRAPPDRSGPIPGARKRRHNSEGSDQRAQPPGHTMYAGSHAAQRWAIGHGWAGPSRDDVLYRQRFGPSSRTRRRRRSSKVSDHHVPTLLAIPCTPGVTRRNARRPGMASCRAGASPTRRRRTLPDWSGTKLPDPGGVNTARRTRITKAEPPGHTMHAGSHTATTPGDRAWPTAGLGRVPPGYDVHYRTGLGPSSRTPEASTQLGWPRITKAEHRDTACTPGVTRHIAGRPDMAHCRPESPAVKWSSRIRHALPDRSGLGSGPRAGRHSPEYSDHQCRALGVAMHSGQATRLGRAPGITAVIRRYLKSAGRVQVTS